jgi:hypothetical protein
MCPLLCHWSPPSSPPNPILAWATSAPAERRRSLTHHRSRTAGVRPVTGAIPPLRRTTSRHNSTSLPINVFPSPIRAALRPNSVRPSVPSPRGHQAPSGELAEHAVSNAGRSSWLLSKLVDPRQPPLLPLSSPPSHPTLLCPKRSPLPMAASPSRVPSSPVVVPSPGGPSLRCHQLEGCQWIFGG